MKDNTFNVGDLVVAKQDTAGHAVDGTTWVLPRGEPSLVIETRGIWAWVEPVKAPGVRSFAIHHTQLVKVA